MADNRKPNSVQASMSKAKAGRSVVDITLKCVELCGGLGYGEDSPLETWSRGAKILDIFEGTQQIQQLIIARRLLGKSSAQLKWHNDRPPTHGPAARTPPAAGSFFVPSSHRGGFLMRHRDLRRRPFRSGSRHNQRPARRSTTGAKSRMEE